MQMQIILKINKFRIKSIKYYFLFFNKKFTAIGLIFKKLYFIFFSVILKIITNKNYWVINLNLIF